MTLYGPCETAKLPKCSIYIFREFLGPFNSLKDSFESFIFIRFRSDISRVGQLRNRARIQPNVKSALNIVIMDRNVINGTIPMC